MNNRIVKCLTVFFLTFLFLTSGCASLSKKFVRKRKGEERPQPIITPEKFTLPPVSERYRNYFTYWKYWQIELINNLSTNNETNHKKLIACVEGTLSNFANFKDLLIEEKKKELEEYYKELLAVKNDIEEVGFGEAEYSRLRQILEKQKRQIEKKYSLKDIKSFLIPDQK